MFLVEASTCELYLLKLLQQYPTVGGTDLVNGLLALVGQLNQEVTRDDLLDNILDCLSVKSDDIAKELEQNKVNRGTKLINDESWGLALASATIVALSDKGLIRSTIAGGMELSNMQMTLTDRGVQFANMKFGVENECN